MKQVPVNELPGLIRKFLALICPSSLFEEIEGDLIERYNADLRSKSTASANWRLFWNALWYLRPAILLKNKVRGLLSFSLLLNYFKITGRVMFRNKSFTFINITGLATGITGALLIFLWMHYEFSYDKFYDDNEQIFTAYNRTELNGEINCWTTTPRILAPVLRDEYSGIAEAASYASYGSPFLFKTGELVVNSEKNIFTEPGFLKIFGFPFLQGDAQSALNNPSSIVLSKDFANRLFPYEMALGKTVTISNSGYDFDFTVTGVLNDLPKNTRFSFDCLLPFAFLDQLEGRDENWQNNSVQTFIKLTPSASVEQLNEQLVSIVTRHTNDASDPEIFLYPFSKMHLYGQFENGVESGGRIEVLRLIILLGIFLLVIAAINFVNLSTARASKRSKEIGIRKVIGARRSALLSQFLAESHMLTASGFILAIILTYFLLPAFNQLVGISVVMPLHEPWFWLVCTMLIIVLGSLAGIYPAIVLSAMRPSRVFGNQTGHLGAFFRRILVTLQFGIAVTIIFAAIIINKQIGHVQNRYSGYDKELLLFHPIPTGLSRSIAAYRNELNKTGMVADMTVTASPITDAFSSTFKITWKEKNENEKIAFQRFIIDDKFVSTAGIEIVDGRNLDFVNFPGDSSSALINQSAVLAMGIKEPIGSIIVDGEQEYTIVGIVGDFILQSPFSRISPMILCPKPEWGSFAHIRLTKDAHTGDALAAINEVYSDFEQEQPFDYTFVDEAYNQKFSGIRKTETITLISSIMIMIISCLGLYGLTLFVVQQRLQEVSIRRIFGGTITGIMRLLCFRSVKPIVWSVIIFTPLAWITMNWWLASFEYRIQMHPLDVIATGLILLSVSLLTVVVLIWRASNTNPTEILKTE